MTVPSIFSSFRLHRNPDPIPRDEQRFIAWLLGAGPPPGPLQEGDDHAGGVTILSPVARAVERAEMVVTGMDTLAPPPQGRIRKGGPDLLTAEGAAQLASRIRDYWRGLGYEVRTFTSLAYGDAHHGTTWAVRSDLINGLPPGWRAPTQSEQLDRARAAVDED